MQTTVLSRLFLASALAFSAASANALELEVRATQDKAPVTDLQASNFELRHNGKMLDIESAQYISEAAGTKIYVAVEVPGTDFSIVTRSLEQFLSNELPAGVEISLGGTPFTSDRQKLLEYLATGAKLGSATPSSGLLRLWAAEGNVQVQGRPVLARYQMLAAQLGQLPGRKAVALFRPGLRLISDGLDTRETGIQTQTLRQIDSDVTRNQGPLEEMTSQAILGRVAFYAAIVSQDGASNDFGLTSVSELSGGQALTGGADPGRLFGMILEDSSGYYVLRYSPELNQNGNRVNLRIDVDRKGVDLRSVKRFLDIPAPVSAAADSAVLGLDPAKAELTLSSAYGFVRGPEGKPRLIFTAGVPASQIDGAEEKKGVTTDLTLGGGVPSEGGEFAVSETMRTRRVFDQKAFAKAQKDGSAVIDVSASVDLPGPGEHSWKTVLRDETSGLYGATVAAIRAPDFSLPLATSTIFLSRQAVEIKTDTPAQPWGDVLDYGPSRIIPESTREFRAGDTILFTYTLYNPTPEMLVEPPPVQIALLKGEQQIDGFELDAENMIDTVNKTIRYVGGLKTKGLDPADYIMLSAVPGRNDARQPYTEAPFRLVK